MKAQPINEFKIYGKSILIDYDKEEIIFPENISQDELEIIANYLVEEGFLECILNNNN